jgi:hypothetical protein
VAAQFGLGLLLGHRHQHLGPYGLLHPYPARRSAGDPARSLRGGRNGRHQPVAGILADYTAVAHADHAGRACARADPGRCRRSTRSSC